MNLKFTKMQATGNDYIFVNLFDADDFKIFNEIALLVNGRNII